MSDLIRRAREALVDVTPGPWEVERDKRIFEWVDVAGPSVNVGGPTWAFGMDANDKVARLADARFIAAARDLVPAMADRLEAQEALLREALAALGKLHHAVCGETGFAQCVRDDSKTLYPWPALDVADHAARATLAKLRSHMGETE